MKNYVKRLAPHYDFGLLITYIVLLAFGLMMVYSSSMVWAMNYYDRPPNSFFVKQALHAAVGLILFAVGSWVPLKLYREKWFIVSFMVLTFFGLGIVHFIGAGDAVGARSWIYTPFGSIQPSEFAKVFVIVYFASFFAKKAERGTLDDVNWTFIPAFLVLSIIVTSIMLETDIGATLIVGSVSLAILIASGITIQGFTKIFKWVFPLLAVGALVIFLAWDKVMTDGRLGRFLAFLDPFEYKEGSGLQIVNSYIAIGNGGLLGNGLGKSVQKTGYLPEPHTDVILAVISEELGVFGVGIVLIGLFIIVAKAMNVAISTDQPYIRMVATGIGSLFAIQTFINVGGMTGIIPLTGVTLPLISYGGTSLMLLSFLVGMLMNIKMTVGVREEILSKRKKEKQPTTQTPHLRVVPSKNNH